MRSHSLLKTMLGFAPEDPRIHTLNHFKLVPWIQMVFILEKSQQQLHIVDVKITLLGGTSRWWRSKTWRSPSSPQIHQKYIYLWNSSYRTPTECCRRPQTSQKARKSPCTWEGQKKKGVQRAKWRDSRTEDRCRPALTSPRGLSAHPPGWAGAGSWGSGFSRIPGRGLGLVVWTQPEGG